MKTAKFVLGWITLIVAFIVLIKPILFWTFNTHYTQIEVIHIFWHHYLTGICCLTIAQWGLELRDKK